MHEIWRWRFSWAEGKLYKGQNARGFPCIVDLWWKLRSVVEGTMKNKANMDDLTYSSRLQSDIV